MIVLFPCNYDSIKKVDYAFAEEYDEALATSLVYPVFFDFDSFLQTGELKLSETDGFKEVHTAVMRGWMINDAAKYRKLYDALLERNIRLITAPKAYETMHFFPNAYPYLEGDTPEIMVHRDGDQIDIRELMEGLGDRFLVKDAVKSAKNDDFPKFLESAMGQEEFEGYLEKFKEIRGDLFTGEYVFKQYVPLAVYGGKTNEYRVFVANYQILSVCRNSEQTEGTAEPPREFIERFASLPSPFYTVDVAEKEDGSWTVVEVGDGSVSGLSPGQDARAFYRALAFAFDLENDFPGYVADIEDIEGEWGGDLVNEMLEYIKKMEAEDRARMFALTVDDYGLPGIVSGAISYLGRRDDLEALFMNMPEKDKDLREELEGLFQRFLNGEEDITYNVAYGERRFLTPVEIHKTDFGSYKELFWECLNIWEYPYMFHATDAGIRHVWVSFEENGRVIYARYGQVSFGSIRMNGTELADWSCIWGYPGLVGFWDSGWTVSTMYLPERYFKDKAEMLADMDEPFFYPKEDLRSFLFAIVGDG